MRFLTSKPGKITIAVALIVVAVSGGLWWHYTRAHPGLVYTSQGYGGYVSAHGNDQDKHKADPLRPVVIAYNAGHYKDAEAAAQRLIDGTSDSKSPAVRKRAVKARYILAFSAARRKDLQLARERFNIVTEEAAKLPDMGREDPQPGLVPSTLEEEGAYQHAVCTAALGDKKAAEAEYMKFMQDYPESPLISAAATRTERLHNRHMPAEAEAA